MKYRTLRYAASPPLAWVTLSRPHAYNRVNLTMALEIKEVVQRLREEQGVRVAILTGTGSVFSTGREAIPASVSRAKGVPLSQWVQMRRAAAALAEAEVPLIAAVNGDALDHGLELALACDLRIAAGGSVLGITDLARSTLPWDGATQRLPRLVGPGRALEMLLTSRPVPAEEAERMGLVNGVVDKGKVMEAARELAQGIARAAPVAARYVKEAVRAAQDMPLADGLRLEADLNIILHSTRDRAEGIRSFRERQEPRFVGE